MTLPLSTPPQVNSNARWKFMRDVIVFQLKMFLDNMRDFALMPVSLGAALIDLVYRGEREGALFYKVLKWGAHSEKVINVYSAIEHHEKGDFKISPDYTVDGVISRLEGVLVREYEKGGRLPRSKPQWIEQSINFTPKRAEHGTRLAMWLSGPPTNSVA